MPISLNPGVKSLHLRYNSLHTVDASLHFYTALQILDLSHNQAAPSSLHKHQTLLIDSIVTFFGRRENKKVSSIIV